VAISFKETQMHKMIQWVRNFQHNYHVFKQIMRQEKYLKFVAQGIEINREYPEYQERYRIEWYKTNERLKRLRRKIIVCK
jgi:hypothetical protein